MRKIRAKTKEKKTIMKEDDEKNRLKAKKEYDRVKAITDTKRAAYLQATHDRYRAEKAVLRGSGNVFGRSNVNDVVDLLERQKRRKHKQVAEMALAQRGLPLMKSVEMANPLDRIQAKEEKLRREKLDVKNFIPKDVEQLQGLKKLKFVNMSDLARPASTKVAGKDVPDDPHLIRKYVPPELRDQPDTISTVGAAQLHQYVNVEDDWTSRDIAVLSTRSNMKYMVVGDGGLTRISYALSGDIIVTDIILASAKVGSIGTAVFASVLKDIFSLRYLDMSCNLICDKGAVALADAFETLPPVNKLTKVSLAGNRIGLRGIIALVKAVHASKNIEWLSVKNNPLTEYDRQSLGKFMDEMGYSSMDAVTDKDPYPSVYHKAPIVKDHRYLDHLDGTISHAPSKPRKFVL